MSTPTRVTLRPGERIFINGAVVKAEGRMSFEILNNVPYLLESDIMHAQQTVTPLRQLYYILQTMVLEPGGVEMTRGLYDVTILWITQAFTNPAVIAGLKIIKQQIADGSPFDALKTVRTLIPIEDAILGANRASELRVVGAV